MSCRINQEKKRPSSLPPPCYHRKPIPFYCPSNDCLPSEPKVSKRCRCPSLDPPLTYKPRSKYSPTSPTICIAGLCPQPSYPESYCRPSVSKIFPPSSCARLYICYTNEGSSGYPCYTSNLLECPINI